MRNLKLTIFDKIVLFIAIIAAISLIIGFVAGNYDPRTNMLIAFFGLAYPFLLVINLVLVLWWLLRKKWLIAFGTLGLIGLGWRALFATVGFFGDEGSSKKDSENYVRLMTYNVHQFKAYGEDNNVSTKDKIIEVVKNEHPDVICFQEYYTRFKGEFDTTDSLKKILKTPYFYFLPTTKNNYEAFGLAIFSKYPIKNKGNVLFDSTLRGNESIYVDLEIDQQILRVYNVHFQSISFNKEDYQYVDKVTKKMEAEAKSTKRIASMIKNAFVKRSAQVDLMNAELETCKTPYVIAGDFNDTPASYTVTQITQALNNAFVKQGNGFGKTYNGKFPNFQIDYIAATKEVEIINYQIIKAKLSDHFPVRSDLSLNYTLEKDQE